MELPKNVTQIGETDKSCKIYVEDYVVSYMKQMNRFAEDKEIAIALYGRRSEEQSLTYCFIYGACKLDFLQKPVRHLSQAQNQEIERLRRKYFSNCELIGYTILNGEMIEGIHIAEQNGCRYVKGYACFYEKNDPMLAYMLDSRITTAAPEEVALEKYEEVRRRQEERRQEYAEQESQGRRENSSNRRNEELREDKAPNQEGAYEESARERRASERASKRSVTDVETHMRGMRFAAASMFVVLCLVSVVTLQTDGVGREVGDKVKSLLQGVSLQQKQSDESVQVISDEVINTLVAEEQLTEAIRQENARQGIDSEVVAAQASNVTVGQTQTVAEPLLPTEGTLTPAESMSPVIAQEPVTVPQATPMPTPQPTPVPTPQPTPMPTPEPTIVPVQSEKVYNTYKIRAGDTLIGISTSFYGSEAYVKAICELNHISNPDNIQIGQKILLP